MRAVLLERRSEAHERLFQCGVSQYITVEFFLNGWIKINALERIPNTDWNPIASTHPISPNIRATKLKVFRI